MALELCIESTGWIAQFAHANGWESVATLVRSGASTRRGANPSGSMPDISDRRREAIRQTASSLPFEQAQALWLVDSCGYGYADAAEIARVDRSTMAERVANGRRSIRERIFPVTG